MNDIKTIYKFDAASNRDVIQRVQDCEPIVQEIKDIKQVTDGRGDTSLGYHVGRIPAMVVEQYLKFAGITFHDFCTDTGHVHKIMNDPDYARFRIFEGRIGKGG